MKILLYLAAGNGDLINFTGVLNVLKNTHSNYTFDFLCLKKHSYIIENHPAINKIFYIEDYPTIPKHCTFKNHDSEINKQFSGYYNHILNCWGCKVKSPNDNNGDYANVMLTLMRQYGFYLPVKRTEVNPMFYYNIDDYKSILNYEFLLNKKVVLIEEESFSWKSPQTNNLKAIKTYLRDNDFTIVSNSKDNDLDVDISALNLKQVKLFFDTYGKVFLGLSSGMTCSIYSTPNYYLNKLIIVSGCYPGWNVTNHLSTLNNYKYFPNAYTLEDIKILTKGL